MTTKSENSLFNTPMDELREAFVCARFGENQNFGNPDTEAWLEGEHDPSDPEYDSSPWTTGLVPLVKAFEHEYSPSEYEAVLSRAATRLERPLSWHDQLKHGQKMLLTDLLSSHPEKVLYESACAPARGSRDIVIVLEGSYVGCMRVNPGARTYALVREIAACDVVGVLLNEVRQNRPKRLKALSILTRVYRLAIQAVREQAEADFDEAVAVSPDGTKIVKANWVAVVEYANPMGSCVHIFPADRFHNQKALRPDNFQRSETTFRACRIELSTWFQYASAPPLDSEEWGSLTAQNARNFVDWYLRKEHLFCTLVVLTDIDQRVLAIDSSLCPPELLEEAKREAHNA